MRKRWMAFCLIGMAVVLTGCSKNGGSGNTAKKNYVDEVQAETYSVYAIPVEAGAEYQAYDTKEQPVDLLDGRFAVREAGDYYYSKNKDGKLTWHKVSVRDTTAPKIQLSYQKRYAAPGSETELPAVRVTDSDGTIDYTLTVTQNGTEISAEEGNFTPVAEGEYIISVTAADNSGNTAEESAVVVCTTDQKRLNCIYEMDTAYGLEEQTTTQIGVRLQLCDESAPDGAGAAKVKVVASRTFVEAQEHLIFFREPFMLQWKDSLSGIYFWIRNVSDVPYDLDFMGEGIRFTLENGATTTLLTKEMGWQKVELTELDKFLPEDGRSFAGMIDMEDGVGMHLGIKQAGAHFKYGEILLSSIYGVPKATE